MDEVDRYFGTGRLDDETKEEEDEDEDSDGQPDVCDPNDESYVDDPDYRWNPDLICTDT